MQSQAIWARPLARRARAAASGTDRRESRARGAEPEAQAHQAQREGRPLFPQEESEVSGKRGEVQEPRDSRRRNTRYGRAAPSTSARCRAGWGRQGPGRGRRAAAAAAQKRQRERPDRTTRHTRSRGAKVILVARPRPAKAPRPAAARRVSHRAGSAARATTTAPTPAPRASASGSAWTRESEKRVPVDRSGVSWKRTARRRAARRPPDEQPRGQERRGAEAEVHPPPEPEERLGAGQDVLARAREARGMDGVRRDQQDRAELLRGHPGMLRVRGSGPLGDAQRVQEVRVVRIRPEQDRGPVMAEPRSRDEHQRGQHEVETGQGQAAHQSAPYAGLRRLHHLALRLHRSCVITTPRIKYSGSMSYRYRLKSPYETSVVTAVTYAIVMNI